MRQRRWRGDVLPLFFKRQAEKGWWGDDYKSAEIKDRRTRVEAKCLDRTAPLINTLSDSIKQI